MKQPTQVKPNQFQIKPVGKRKARQRQSSANRQAASQPASERATKQTRTSTHGPVGGVLLLAELDVDQAEERARGEAELHRKALVPVNQLQVRTPRRPRERGKEGRKGQEGKGRWARQIRQVGRGAKVQEREREQRRDRRSRGGACTHARMHAHGRWQAGRQEADSRV